MTLPFRPDGTRNPDFMRVATDVPDTPFNPDGSRKRDVLPNPQDAARLRLVQDRASGVSPEDAMEAFRLGVKTDVPRDVVLRNLDTVKEREAAFDPEAFVREANAVARWVSTNEANAALAKDDLENLGTLERLLGSWRNPEAGVPFSQRMTDPLGPQRLERVREGLVSKELTRGFLTVERGQLGVIDETTWTDAQRARLADIESELAQELPESRNFVESMVRGSAAFVPSSVVAAAEGVQTGLATATVAGALTAFAGPLAPVAILPVAAKGFAIGSVVGAFQSASQIIEGNAYLNYRKQGISAPVARNAAAFAGSVGGLLESASYGVLLKPFTDPIRRQIVGAGVSRALQNPTVKAALLRGAEVEATGVLTETTTETLQQALELAGEQYARQVEGLPSIEMDRVREELFATATETFIGALLLPLPGAALSTGLGLQQAADAQQTKNQLLALSDAAEASKVRERLPEAFREVADAIVAEHGPVQHAFVPVDRLVALLQEYDVPEGEFIETALGGNADALEQAKATGGDVVIPFARYIELSPSPLGRALADDTRLELGAPTAREARDAAKPAEADIAAIKKDMEELVVADLTDASERRVVDALLEQALATGMSEGDARINAEAAAKFWIVQARRYQREAPGHRYADAYTLWSERGVQAVGVRRAEALLDAQRAMQRARKAGKSENEIAAIGARLDRLVNQRQTIRSALEAADVRDETGRLAKDLKPVDTDALAVEVVRMRQAMTDAQGQLATLTETTMYAEAMESPTQEEAAARLEDVPMVAGVTRGEMENVATAARIERDLRKVIRQFERSLPRLERELASRGVESAEAYLSGSELFADAEVEGVPFQVEALNILEQAAFHGSPYVFDRFSLSAIGTGEGAQAYGWGLYFAESQYVAEGYAKSVVSDAQVYEAMQASAEWSDYRAFQEYVDPSGEISAEEFEAASDETKRGWLKFLWDDYKKAAVANGQVYRVDIPDDAVARMLDWDKPLSKQALEVQAILRGMGIGAAPDAEARTSALANARAAYDKAYAANAPMEELRRLRQEIFNAEDDVRNIGAVADPTGQVIYNGLPGTQREASLALLAAGIPGIKYLDAGSRIAGEGSRNLVVFDENLVTITQRNGEPVSAQERADFLEQEAAPRLQALHNLSADNLRFAADIGGLAVPSLGVTPEGMSFEGMGEITLIGDQSLADPTQADVYDADAYTVTFPRPEYNKAKSKDALALYRKFADVSARFDDSLANELSDNASAGRPDKSVEMMLRSPAAIATFLEEKGITLDPVLYPEQREYNNVDRFASREAALKALEGYEPEYKEWVDAQVLPIHGDPFLKQGRKKVAYSLENIVEEMQGQRAAVEKTMTFGAGKARAAAAQRFTDLEWMRNASYRIGTAEQVAMGRKESDAVLQEYRNAAAEYHTSGDTWTAMDASMRAIARFAKGRGMAEALRAEGFRNVPADIVELGKRAGQAMLAAPVPYFEAKVQRAVSLSEFAGAVIPSDASAETRQILEDAGVRIAEYTDAADRNRVITELNAQLSAEGRRTLFQGRQRRPQAFYLPRERVIGLLRTADRSSFMHEMSHHYLRVLRDLAREPDAPVSIRTDYDAALTYIGVTPEERDAFERYAERGFGDVTEQTKQFVKYEEKWARSFEAYLQRGIAPSRGLQRAFRRYKVWLTSIYSGARAAVLPEVNPDLINLFDRLLATDEEMAELQSQPEHRPFFKPGDTGITDAEYEAYVSTLELVDAQTDAELTRAILAETERERTDAWQTAEAEVRAEVEAEIDAEPIEVARRVMQQGILPDGTTDTPNALNRQAIVNTYGAAVPKSLPLWAIKKDGGLDADAAALIAGFPDGDTLIAALQVYVPRDRRVAAEVSRRMREQFPDLLNDSPALAEAAQTAAHRAQNDDGIVWELKKLGKVLGIQPPSLAAVKAAARQIVDETVVRDLSPYRHLLAERKAARMAEQAKAAGNLGKAEFHKRQQLLNRVLYRESQQAVERVDVIARFGRRMSEPASRARLGKVGQSYLEAMDAITQGYEFARVPLRELARRERISAFAAEMTAQGIPIPVPPSVLEDAEVVNYRTVPYGKLTDVYDTARMINHLAGLKGRLLREAKKRELAAIEDEIVETIARERGGEARGYEERGARERFRDTAAGVHAAHLKPEFFFVWLDGDKVLGPVFQALFRPIADAESAANVRLKAMLPQLDAVLTKHLSKVERAALYQRVAVPGHPEIAITKASILALARNMGNETSREAVYEQKKNDGTPLFTPAQINAMLGTLTAAEWRSVQAAWDVAESLWPDIKALDERVVGVAPQKVEAVPFTVQTADGQTIQLAGGYYPLSYDTRMSTKQYFQEATGTVQDYGPTSFLRAATQHGHTESRVGSGGKPIRLDLSVLNEHVINVIHDLTHREAILDVGRLLERPRIAAAIQNASSPEMYRTLRPWLARVANDRKPPIPHALESVLGHARVGTTIVNMGLKATTALVQPTGFLNSVELIGAKYARRGLTAFLSDPKGQWEWVKSQSPAMATRQQSFDRDVRDIAKRKGKLSDKDKVFFWTTGFLDMAVAVPTWLGAYAKAIETQRLNHEDAVAAADSAVRLSQGAGAAKDLAAIQGGPEVQRLYTTFYTFWSALYGLFHRSVSNVQTGRYSIPRFGASILSLWFVQAILSEIIAGRGPEEDEDWGEWAAWELARYPFNGVILARDVANALGPDGFDFQLSPTAGAFASLTKALKAVGSVPFEMLDDEAELTQGELKSIVEAAGYWGHLPTRQMWITGTYLYDWMMGYEAPESAQEAARNLFFTRPR